jgi:hypothetical protein
MAIVRKEKGDGTTTVCTPPLSELPPIVPAAPLARRSDGTIADKETAQALGRKSAASKAIGRRLFKELGAVPGNTHPDFAPYWALAQRWFEQEMEELANRSGGYVGPSATGVMRKAAEAFAWSEYCSAKAAEEANPIIFDRSAKYGEVMRQHLLAADTLATRQAAARKAQAKPQDPYAAFRNLAEEGDE